MAAHTFVTVEELCMLIAGCLIASAQTRTNPEVTLTSGAMHLLDLSRHADNPVVSEAMECISHILRASSVAQPPRHKRDGRNLTIRE